MLYCGVFYHVFYCHTVCAALLHFMFVVLTCCVATVCPWINLPHCNMDYKGGGSHKNGVVQNPPAPNTKSVAKKRHFQHGKKHPKKAAIFFQLNSSKNSKKKCSAYPFIKDLVHFDLSSWNMETQNLTNIPIYPWTIEVNLLDISSIELPFPVYTTKKKKKKKKDYRWGYSTVHWVMWYFMLIFFSQKASPKSVAKKRRQKRHKKRGKKHRKLALGL